MMCARFMRLAGVLLTIGLDGLADESAAIFGKVIETRSTLKEQCGAVLAEQLLASGYIDLGGRFGNLLCLSDEALYGS